MADYMPESNGLASVLQSYLNNATSRRAPSVIDSENASSVPNIAVVVAVVEGKRSLESMTGVASVDLNTLEIKLAQFRDPFNYTITKEYIKSLSPDVVIYPGYERKNLISTNPQFTSGSDILVEPYDVQYFDEMRGQELLLIYGKNFSPRDLGFSKVLPVVAASACFNYILYLQNVKEFSPNCMDVIIPHKDGYLTMDLTTVKTLEILASADTGDCKRSLFWLLNRTYTRRGMRILRANLVQPPAVKETIIRRQDAVEELVKKPVILNELGNALDAFGPYDLDYTLRSLVVRHKAPTANKASRYIESLVDVAVYLREILSHVKDFMNVLQDLNSPFFQRIFSEMSKDVCVYEHLSSRIRQFISDSCTVTRGNINYKTSKLFAINPQVDPFLEIKLKTYSEFLENMASLASTYERSYNRPIRVNFQATRGYHFLIPIAEEEQKGVITLPNVFVCAQRRGKSISATTKALMDIETNLHRVEKDIYKMAGEAVIKLMEDISLHIDSVSSLFENIGTVDFIRCLASAAHEYNFIRPTIGNKLQGKNIINPLLFLKHTEKDTSQRAVSNTIPRLSSGDISMMLLTGANQSGKSCYLTGVALLQIMAQIGSFVPAEEGQILVENSGASGENQMKSTGSLVVPIVDQIFTRMGMDDDYMSSSSSFLKEVSQISYITRRATKNSLVIIDELGRGTSVEEGVSFCFAVAEKLLKTHCITLLASHFHDLIKLECLYPNVVCYQMEHKKVPDPTTGLVKLIFTHKAIVMGDDHFTEYGIDTAEALGLPKEIITMARNILPHIQTLSSEVTVEARKRREMYKLYLAILKIAETDWSTNRVGISEFFEGAKQQYLLQMKRIQPSLERQDN